MNRLLDDLLWRGLVYQSSDGEGLAARFDAGQVTGYIGFDPSAESLHVGHLQQILLLRRVQEAGHRPIALVGGGTGMIGDPSGRSDERTLLDAETLARNRDALGVQLSRFLDFGDGAAILADNAEWLANTNLLEFLRDVGKFFSVNEMIRKDSVRSRLEEREQSLSFTEFSYMLLQSWDFVQLFDRFDCELQMGGSDQWGNITEGIDLIRRLRAAKAFGLTSPLVVKADGRPFGKTESGAVWLDARKTSPYQMFQFWLRTEDPDAGPYLRRLTFLSREAIESLDVETAEHPERRIAQRALAREITTMVHGREDAERAERASEALFSEDIAGLDALTLEMALSDAPSVELNQSDLAAGVDIVEVLVSSGLASSRAEARRHLGQGGVYVNGARAGEETSLGPSDALHGRWIVLRRGRAEQRVLVVQK